MAHFPIRRTALRLSFALMAITGCHMNDTTPSKYFDGQYLRAAMAIDGGNESALKATIPHIDVNGRGREDMTLLWYAIIRSNYVAIRDLVSAGYRPDDGAINGLGTPLEDALASDDLRLLKAMLDGGVSPDLQTKGGTTLLQRALYGDKAFDRVRLLVERGANINRRDSIDGTALLDAILLSKPEIAIYLIEHGADVHATMASGVSVAYAVQGAIDDSSQQTLHARVTDYSIDEDGKLLATDQTPPVDLSPRSKALLKKFEHLRALMIAKGAKFPPDPPEQVRERMQTR